MEDQQEGIEAGDGMEHAMMPQPVQANGQKTEAKAIVPGGLSANNWFKT